MREHYREPSTCKCPLGDALSARLPRVAVLGFERTEPKDRHSCKRPSVTHASIRLLRKVGYIYYLERNESCTSIMTIPDLRIVRFT